MSSVYDNKGKSFTPVVHTIATPVIIQTATNRIKGNLHLREAERIKDVLNASEDYIAVTDATVMDGDGIVNIYQAPFLALNRANVIWVIEDSPKQPGS
jgi:hypothetical protein